MSELSVIALFIGLLAMVGGGFSLAAPARVSAGLAAFPRSIWPGRVLAAIDLVWAAYELSRMHLGGFDAWKVHLYWLTPIAVFLCVKFLDELLSPRALGGFLLLAVGPMLDAARWHPSDWRLVITVIAYLWVVAGLVFLLSPWWFRRVADWTKSFGDSLLRVGGAVKALMGLGLVVLALFVY
jgi:uncharacterized protein YjeT (DUF2065 family)